MDTKTQAKMWYYIALKPKFRKLKLSQVKKLSQDISDIVGIIPIEYNPKDFQSHATIISKLNLNYNWKVTKDNYYYVQNFKFKLTNLKLYTLLEMCLDRLTKQSIRSNDKYEYLVFADRIMEMEGGQLVK
jgi:hypothetical protein